MSYKVEMKYGVEGSMLNWVRSRSGSHTFSTSLHISDALWGQARSVCCNSTHKTSAEAIPRRLKMCFRVCFRDQNLKHTCVGDDHLHTLADGAVVGVFPAHNMGEM